LIKKQNKDYMLQKCKLCNGNLFSTKYIFKDCKVICCNSCGLVQVKDGPDTSEIYSQKYFSHDKLGAVGIRTEPKRRLKWLRQCGLKPGMQILDAGCATGEFLSMASQNYDVHGVDISSFAIEQAMNHYPFLKGRLKAGPLEEVEFSSFNFDAIVMWDVIEHLQNPRQVVNKLSRLLKAGGIFCISTPNMGTITAKLLGKRWPFMTPPEHQCFFNTTTLSRLMNDCGMEKINEMSRGKWVNIRFLIYKIQRVFPESVMKTIAEQVIRMIPDKLMVYAPTGDVLYSGFTLKI